MQLTPAICQKKLTFSTKNSLEEDAGVKNRAINVLPTVQEVISYDKNFDKHGCLLAVEFGYCLCDKDCMFETLVM